MLRRELYVLYFKEIQMRFHSKQDMISHGRIRDAWTRLLPEILQ